MSKVDDIIAGRVASKSLDEFDLSHLDFDAAEAKAEVMGGGGGEILEPSNVCESGACMI